MVESGGIMFIYVETPLHAGAGRGLGAIDLPIQRERTTGYPLVQASTIKGCLRSEARALVKARLLNEDEFEAIFGPDTERASEHAGALTVGDAHLALLPLRSLAGVFAWATSVGVLARFRRFAQFCGVSPAWSLPPEPSTDGVWVNGSWLVASNSVVLDDFSFSPLHEHATQVEEIGRWLAENALPARHNGNDVYSFWREGLPDRLCVLPEVIFRDFACYSTDVQTHIRLDPDTKTVDGRALWTVESLPVDTILYAPLSAGDSRRRSVDLSAAQVLDRVVDLGLLRIQLGGNETTGQGIVSLRFLRPSRSTEECPDA